MQNSGNSSPATATPDSQPGITRSRFALTGRSVHIDPRTDAARRDLADVRLADRVFAPHYAAPVAHVVIAPVSLRAAKEADAEVMTQLATGDVFEVLELSAGNAWGRAPGAGLVGYVDATQLKVAT